jgi:O-antigen/teichoic acid export membrane protein
MQNTETKSIKKNAFFAIVKDVANMLFPVIIFAYVSRKLNPDGIGQINFSNTYVNYFILLAGLGINRYGTRECARIKENKEKINEVASELLFINVCATVISFVIFGISLKLNKSVEPYLHTIYIYAVAIPLSAMSMEWIYQAMEEYEYITKRVLLFRVVGLLLTFVLVRDKSDLYKFAAIQVIANYGNYILNFVNARKYIKLKKIHLANLRRHLIPMLVLFSASLSSTLYSNIDVTMLGLMVDETAVGIYSAATKIVHMVSAVMISGILVFLPRMSLLVEKNNSEMVEDYQKKLFNIAYLVTIPCVCFVIVWSKSAIYLLAGKEFEEAGLILNLLSVVLFTVVSKNLFENAVLLPNRRDNLVMLATVIGACFNILCNYILIPKFAVYGATIASVLSEMAVFCIYLYNLRCHAVIRGIFKNLIRYIICGLWIILCWMLLRRMLKSEVLIAIVTSVIGGGGYVGFLCLLKDTYLKYIIAEGITRIRK